LATTVAGEERSTRFGGDYVPSGGAGYATERPAAGGRLSPQGYARDPGYGGDSPAWGGATVDPYQLELEASPLPEAAPGGSASPAVERAWELRRCGVISQEEFDEV